MIILPRPRKWRRVCSLPQNRKFGPLNTAQEPTEFVNLTVDEYETIRLIDLQGFTQEECAKQMDIARTTVQRIYIDAREKLADFLVNGKFLTIEGGNFKLCDGFNAACGFGRCKKHRHGGGFENRRNKT